MLSEQRVTWDCIWFGRYPQAEVVPEAEEYTPLDGKLLREGDLIRDDILYRALQETDAWDERGDVVLAGEKYRRIRSRDVINGMYRESGYYQWKDADTYHYFKYQPIKWRILSVSDSKMMLLADRALDNQRYHASNTEVTWEKCTMRSWLNGYGASENKQGTDYTGGNFIDTAFSQSEQQIISIAAVKNEDGMVCGTEGGADTRDKIFLLSEAEVYTAAAKPYGFTAGKVSVPNTVKLYGVSYKVTAIGKKAFYNNRKLRSVTVGKNVKQIRAKAFHGCTKLRYLVSEGMEG